MKPLWRDGLFMMPQHLQLFDEHVEEELARRFRVVEAHGYGVLEMTVDQEALLRGMFQLRRLSALLPDGLWVEIGPEQPVQEAQVMVGGALAGGGKRAEVYLAVPSTAGRGSATYAGEAGARGARFLRTVHPASDAYGTAEETEVEVVRPHAQLLLGTDDRQQYVTLKLAELEVGEGGTLVVSEAFVPPALAIKAAPALVSRLDRLLASIGGKLNALASRYRGRSTALVEFGPADVTAFWYLYTLNAVQPRLVHYAQLPRLHPERLYLALAELKGQLSTFEPQRKPKDTPPYDHQALALSIYPLFEAIQALLGIVLAEQYVSVPLEQVQPGYFVAKKVDPELFKKHRFYLVATKSGEATEKQLRQDLPHYVRISSFEQIGRVVQSNVPGLPATVDLQPPTAIPVKAENVYLRLGQEGQHWKEIVRTGSVAIFQPVKPQLISLELLAVEG